MSKTFKLSTTSTSFLADLVTPLAAYMRIREHFPESVLLESTDRQGGKKDLSYVCCDPIAELSVGRDGLVTYIINDGSHVEPQKFEYNLSETTALKRNYLQYAFEDFQGQFEVEKKSDSKYVNGLIGFTSYDAIEIMEDISLHKQAKPAEDIPLAFYRLFRHVLIFDHQSSELHFLQNEINRQAELSEARKILAIIQSAGFQIKSFRTAGNVSSNMTETEHAELIEKCKTHIRRGDVFQIVPSRKYFQSFEGDDLNVYRALRVINPSPHLFYFKTKDFCLFGSSPEAQIQVSGPQVSINPIAGTYLRTGNDDQDEKAALALSEDPKEVSEHVMLVDLARNDLSVHCDNVTVSKFKQIEYYSHVIHLVSTVTGTLLPGKSSLGAFCSTAPAGTLSGAPKYKAMQLLDLYEPDRRHFYGGSVGVLSLNGDIVHAIMIRSFLSRKGVLSTQAGSGIVCESDTAKEVQEVKNKLAALWAAVEKAQTL